MSRLSGKTALITGSTSNIGQAIAKQFSIEGAHVVVTGRDAGRGAAIVAEIRSAGGHADFVAAELDGSPEQTQHLAEQAIALLGRVDVLVNNVGIYPAGTTLTTDSSTFDQIFSTSKFPTTSLLP